MPRLAALLLHLTLLLPAASDAPPPDARQLMARSTPAEMEQRLEADRSLVPSTLGILAAALAGDDPVLVQETADYLAAAARSRSRRLGAARAWQPRQVEDLLVLQLVQPERFVEDAAFRRRVLDLLPRALDPAVPLTLRNDLLAELNQIRGVDFAASETVENAWGAVPRSSGERRTAAPSPSPRFGHDTGGAIAASVYSLSSTFFSTAEATAFLTAVHEAAPERRLLVLADPPLQRALASRYQALGVRLLPTFGRPYSPWPRDPFSLARDPGGRLLVLLRPNAQPGREEDLFLGRELVQNLPGDLDKAWGQVHWAEAPVPFHNGQILLTPGTVWLSLHTLEPHILEILGLSRVPVESFGTAAGIDRYQAAAGKAAQELAAFYGRPVRFVHPLASLDVGSTQDRRRLLGTLGGGAGYDLDSLLTLLPRPDGGLTALVADVSAGRRLLTSLSAENWSALERGYGLRVSGGRLREVVAAAQETVEATRLDGFLDLMAEHLKKEGLEVRRLPLLAMPVALLRDRAGLEHQTFLLTWNNVVVETRGDLLRAEGFASLLPAGDREARASFAAAGARLDLFPPLVRSVVLNGGYRCASNHVRE